MNPELTRQFGDRPIPLDRRQRHLRFERPVVLLACPLHVLLPRHRRFLGAGLHLSLLSHFPGPAHGGEANAGDPKGGTGYRWFESISLQRRISCQLTQTTREEASRTRAWHYLSRSQAR